MKRIYRNSMIGLLLGFFLAFSSCGDAKKEQNENQDNKTKTYSMYTVFFGEHPAILDEEGNVGMPKFNFTVEITKEAVISKMFGDSEPVSIPYKVTGENDSLINIETSSLHDSIEIKMQYI